MLGKIARIHTRSFTCHVTTAKEGLFKPPSTVVSDAQLLDANRTVNIRPCAKIIYTPSLGKAERLQFHDALVAILDSGGEAGQFLGNILANVFSDWKARGIAVEAVNLGVSNF